MVEAFVLIQTEVGRAEVIAKQLAGLTGVVSAEYVTGPYDVVVRVAANSLDELKSTVVPSVQQVAGITRTLTCPIADGARP
ncbi:MULTISPECIES: Lrp/AsnC ligand binding domain-containing protein [Mycolicibacterium]|uniref:Lrp/AsnC ligand binding domain-containing protein n=1 Tax=Mycolicibacterium TaxID=1866885 RepID=UPI0005678D83|nr:MULTISPECIES: Lrp/AsnC ligand binding domain-containing protein [Mycolicibacterium]MDW5614767.1 Lrp/AsnC ligand binding domain-containing protein [Mycolicibacterium sp. D5.8-2]QZT58942.1 Lrp/AsnC ligand binding domain-containing protein [Mycolicibacterium austroafricanum]QZY48201.1 Lrp/AsnC ligand binding domain-containing protein [Mycolicibacterium austroafricanum]UJL26711.1 Lrp/AsnC ligand binding domain-containing protein [Mycolicibacterium vanbaalenii]WND58823.1 Lrp/AsnC ligand binding 